MPETNFSTFTNYKQTVIELTGDLKKLREYCGRFNLEGSSAAIDDVLTRLAEDTFSVAIVGEFKRGKSTLINALLEKDVLPTSVIPTTATLNKVAYSVTPFVRIEFTDGHTEDIEIDRLNDYVTKLTPESEQMARTVKIATVYYPVNYCKNGVTIIDTPGLNDDESMTEVTLSVLPQIDAAIMVMMGGSPFSSYERDFLENQIIASDLGRVLFVVTGMDLYDEDEREQILTVIRNRIVESVLKKAKSVYGENSKEYDNYRRKLGSIRVYGVSAKKALKAKKKGDPEMLAAGFFPEFEAALERFLTEERGAVMLNVPLSRIKSSAMELGKAVDLRQNALVMEKEAFNESYRKAMEEISRIRTDRQQEFQRITDSADRTYQELMPAIRDYWPTLEQAAEEAIDGYAIASVDELKEPALQETQEGLTKAVKSAISRASQNVGERIQSAINGALEEEAQRLSGFESRFFEATEQIQNLFVPADAANGSGGDMLISVVASSLLGYGLGGLYLGYKEAGWKGALLGGGTSFAGTMAAGFGASLLLSALSIPLTWPVMLVAGVAAATVGAFTGKWALGRFFGESRIERFKDSFKEAVHGELARMKAEDDFSENVRAQIMEAFNALKEKIRTETETILGDTQNQLTQLKVELAQAGSREDLEKEELKAIVEDLDGICRRADEIGRQLTQVLAGEEAV